MAASDVLALNKEYTEGTVTLPESIFTEKEIEVENEDGSVTQKTVMSADLDYVANALKDAGLIEYKGLFKFFCRFTDADIDMDQAPMSSIPSATTTPWCSGCRRRPSPW